MKVCAQCDSFADFSGSPLEHVFGRGIPKRCLKEENRQCDWPPCISDEWKETCRFFSKRRVFLDKYEWDERKNVINISKHGISFQDAISKLESDENRVRIICPPENWETLDNEQYGEDIKQKLVKKGVPPFDWNCDPVRDQHLFMSEKKLYELISTMRGNLGNSRIRVITAHITSSEIDMDAYRKLSGKQNYRR
jgi:hypothetical protein